VEAHIHVLLTSALDVGEWSASSPDRFHPPKERTAPVERRTERLQSRSGHASYLPCNRNQIPRSSSQQASNRLSSRSFADIVQVCYIRPNWSNRLTCEAVSE